VSCPGTAPATTRKDTLMKKGPERLLLFLLFMLLLTFLSLAIGSIG
jgi:hypothetical protein